MNRLTGLAVMNRLVACTVARGSSYLGANGAGYWNHFFDRALRPALLKYRRDLINAYRFDYNRRSVCGRETNGNARENDSAPSYH